MRLTDPLVFSRQPVEGRTLVAHESRDGGGHMLQVGDMAPELGVADHLGKVRTLAEFTGKKILLWFYPKADTPG